MVDIFYSLLENNNVANATLLYRPLTVFAPTNKAFQNFETTAPKDSLVSYHMATLPLTLSEMSSSQSVPTDYEGNPPLWITKNHRNEIYVNNARVIIPKSNIQAWNQRKKKQVLHMIDEVLEPVISTNPSVPLYNPDAYQFLNQSENIGLGKHRIRSFRQRVILNNKESIYRADGRYTFFIPVDEGFTRQYKRNSDAIPPQLGGSIFLNVSMKSFADLFKPPSRPEKIDQKVIDGHVIPHHVLFTGATPQGIDYKTLAFHDMMKVTISFTQQNDGKHSKLYVKSHTIVGDDNHPTGVVLAEIVRANIPVKNGVVHLIRHPLMVVDTTVEQFLKEKNDGPLYRFYKVIMDAGGDFIDRINRKHSGVTLFAPSNAAWSEMHLDQVMNDKKKLRQILDLHLVEMKLPMDVIMNNNNKELFQVVTAGGQKILYFNVAVNPNNNKTLTVEGGGVNATVIQPDIAAENGIVHIIDHVLGVPFQNVRDKLASDPMLNKTFYLGERTNFNDQLKNLNRKFTYFVPRDYAWHKAEIMYPSAHKKLFMPEFGYHVRQILERHLVIHDKVFTMADLKQNHNDTFTLPTLRDSLKIKIKEVDKGYVIDWRGESIPVFRPDVHCTNGIIHVIDRVLLQDSDVRINGEPRSQSVSLTLYLSIFFILIFIWSTE
ncbi:hypothetical protein RUM44_005141 [Polyplax serrata]|uniref:FAS1 domain-containing protein n=1 Tax=Polyplax serrata TaxID=468196 RepID=A0ABR1AE62_POLSC